MQQLSREWMSQKIVEGTPDAVIFADHEGVIRLWNAGAEVMFGYSAEEAIGKTLDLIIPERLQQRHWDGYHKVMATGETRYGRELLAVPAMHRDGQRISIEFSIALIRGDANEIVGVAAVMRDVTARREQERALRERLAAAEAKSSTPSA